LEGYRHGSQTVFIIHLHIVWITKYRKPILEGDVAYRERRLIREICRSEADEEFKNEGVDLPSA
jgi:putative transposase